MLWKTQSISKHWPFKSRQMLSCFFPDCSTHLSSSHKTLICNLHWAENLAMQRAATLQWDRWGVDGAIDHHAPTFPIAALRNVLCLQILESVCQSCAVLCVHLILGGKNTLSSPNNYQYSQTKESRILRRETSAKKRKLRLQSSRLF